MAKFEKRLKGDFTEFLKHLDDEITKGSISSSYEDGTNAIVQGAKVAVRVYERYSMFGANRVSLNITVVEENDEIFISGITSGGSHGSFLKINIVGEETFLYKLEDAVEDYMDGKNSHVG